MSETRPIVCLVVAVAENGIIGRGGALPWRMPSDLKTFRRLTLGKPIIMGRKTWASIGKPLDGRDNIVVTRDRSFAASGAIVASSLQEAIEEAGRRASARGVTEMMVIGGADIYRQALPLADRIYLTRIHVEPDGDARFDDPDPADWHLASSEPVETGPRDEATATLLRFERRRSPLQSFPRAL